MAYLCGKEQVKIQLNKTNLGELEFELCGCLKTISQLKTHCLSLDRWGLFFLCLSFKQYFKQYLTLSFSLL